MRISRRISQAYTCFLHRAPTGALVAFSALAFPVSVTSAELFQIEVDYGIGNQPPFFPLIDNQTFQRDDVESFGDLLSSDDDFLDQLQFTTGSRGDQPFSARAGYLGLGWLVETEDTAVIDAPNYADIEFSVSCNSNGTYDQTLLFNRNDTQQENLEDLVDFLKGDRRSPEGELLTTSGSFNLGACLVSGSPVDPVAGNPNSLMAIMAESDYLLGAEEGLEYRAPWGVGLGGSTVSAEDFDSWSVTLPINYIHAIPRVDSRPLLLIFDAPLRYVELEGARVIDGSLAFGVRYPLLDNWALTPMLRAGLTASEDTGSLQAIYSGSLTSHLAFYPIEGRFTLSLNNAVGYYQTDSIDAGDFDMEYDTDNVIWRNGLALSSRLPWIWLDQPTTWELQLVDTRIDGDDWYYDYYDELVLSFGTMARPDRMKWQDLRFGVKYSFAPDYDSVEFVMNYRF